MAAIGESKGVHPYTLIIAHNTYYVNYGHSDKLISFIMYRVAG